jgi:aspartyl-tRNA(Asn)/glutamyl-tRNA(Gln) amidotransferase subunit A
MTSAGDNRPAVPGGRSVYGPIRTRVMNADVSVGSLTEAALEAVSEKERLNAFISVCRERALRKAADVDRRVKRGEAGRLAGLVLAVKDLIAMKGMPATCGSRMLKSYIPPFDATVVERLEAEDAVIVGKTNMDEFGMGSSNENSAYGPVLNPWDETRIPGGSSGGSAVAVASGMVMAALGTDTGGSVRQPAAHTGTIGLRPTYGRVSRYGLIAFASSLDQIGCITNSIEDSCALLGVIAGHDPRDATSAAVPVPEYGDFLKRDVRGMTFGLPSEYFGKGLDPEIREGVERVVDRLRAGGAGMRTVSLPHNDYGIATYYLICTAEASSNLARYDGVRYGLRSGESSGLESMFVRTRHEGFGDEVKRRVMLGTYVLSAGYYEAYYRKAQKVRTLIRRDFEEAFRTCDAVIGPTCPATAFKLGEKVLDPLSMYLTDIYTVTAPLAGLPAVSIPIGTDRRGLPMGLQITGRAFGEGDMLGAANWVMKEIG